MIDFYAMGSPNVVKIYLALEEMGLDYNVRPIDVFGGAQFADEFKKLNPNAKVPVIVDRDGPGGKPYTVFESGAILIYLAEKTHKFLPKDGAARYDVLQWMMVQMTGVGPMFGQFVHFVRFAPKGNDYSVDRYRTQARRVLETLEGRLSTTTWLGGAEYSIADMATWPWARLVPMLLGPESAKEYPKLTEWAARIGERPAAQRAVKHTDDVRAKTTAFDKAQPDMMDKVFGRGAYKAA
ncbi:MAG: glutathione S-transferase N-terminal domain-containing protein [Alphaproteobacteria bacterium]|nr:glutathione S-transferase N-terminal domain-containing protein [Alphaproteobacteria bacterium]